MLTHQTPDLLVVHDQVFLAQRGTNPAIVVGLEFIADGECRFDDGGIVSDPLRAVVIGKIFVCGNLN
ncbi:MAG: hypothetical protein AAAB35_13330 [Phyllobacterium sp.]|uniref:hypothetical protein n=1 Tax=Phyllobacterium sp. TaxID=1871046 RepID=UPI0030F2A7A8